MTVKQALMTSKNPRKRGFVCFEHNIAIQTPFILFPDLFQIKS